MAITQVITQFPTAPNSLDTPEDFNSKSDAFVAHQAGTYVPEVNELANQMNAEVALINDATADGLQDIATQTSRAASSASSASNSARDAEHSNVASATSANFKGGWDKNTLYKVPSSVYWNGLYYNCLGDSLDDQPDLPNSNWIDGGLDRLPTLAIGNINNPLLDLPLNNSLDMKQGVGSVTFTRASTATYIDRYGVMQYATTDEARFGKEGLLIEGSSTNECLYSDIPDSNWITTRMSISTTEFADAPDGIIQVPKITQNSELAGYCRTKKTSGVADDVVLSASVFIKKGNSNSIRISFRANDDTSVSSFILDTNTQTVSFNDTGITKPFTYIGNGWFRCFSTIISVDGGGYIEAGENIKVENEGCYIFGGQIEEMPFCTSYIPTTTSAVTRVGESTRIDSYGNGIVKEAHSVSMDITLFDGIHDIYREAYSIRGAGTANKFSNELLRVNPNDLDLTFYRGNATITDTGNTDLTISSRIIITIANNDEVSIYGNGELKSQHVSPLFQPNGTMADDIFLGCAYSYNCHLYGHIKNFRIWDRCLTPEEARLA